MFLMIHPINYLFIHPWCIPLNATLLLLTTFRSVISRLIPYLGFWFRRMFTQLKFCLFYFWGQINVNVRLEICPHFSVQALLWGFGSQLPNCIAFRSYEETLPKRQPDMWWEKKSASFLDQKGCHSTASPQVLDAFLLCKYLNHHQESISGIGPSYVTVIGQKVKVAFYKQASIEIAFKKS